jgi:hypothetical protein
VTARAQATIPDIEQLTDLAKSKAQPLSALHETKAVELRLVVETVS